MPDFLDFDSMRWIVLVAILLFIVLAFGWGGTGLRYRAKPLLTENETEFFERLLSALPDYHVFPQVAFRAIMAPYSRSSSKNYMKEFSSIGSKHCDFLICKKGNLMPVAIIELDDKTHSATKDKIRDAMTASAGYKTIRFQSREKPTIHEIKIAIKGAAHE